MKYIIFLFLLLPLSGCATHSRYGSYSYTPYQTYRHTPYQADIHYPLPREYGPVPIYPYDHLSRVIINPAPAYIPRFYHQWQHDWPRRRHYGHHHRHHRHD